MIRIVAAALTIYLGALVSASSYLSASSFLQAGHGARVTALPRDENRASFALWIAVPGQVAEPEAAHRFDVPFGDPFGTRAGVDGPLPGRLAWRFCAAQRGQPVCGSPFTTRSALP